MTEAQHPGYHDTAPDEQWHIPLTAANFEAWRSDPEFQFVVELARAINHLQFGIAALPGPEETELKYRNNPQSVVAVFVATALLEEVSKWLHNCASEKSRPLSPRFQHLPKIFSNDTTEFRDIVNKARNKVGFHLLSHVTSSGLKQLEPGDYTFLEGNGPLASKAVYNFADLVGIVYLARQFRESTDNESVVEFYSGLSEWFTGKALEFISAGNRAITEWFKDRGVEAMQK